MTAAPASVLAQPDLRRWIGFESSGRATVRTGKVELGQGIVTALAQIAAEELGIELAQIDMPPASTAHGPDEGHTVGSLSVEQSGPAVRFVGACLRQRLLAAAARRLGIDAAQGATRLNVRCGTVELDGQATPHSYWSLASALLREPLQAGESAPHRPAAQRAFTGRDVPRLDLRAKLRGGGFIHDLELPHMCHAAVLRQPWPGAQLLALDEAALAARHPALQWLRRRDFVAVVAVSDRAARADLARLARLAQWQPRPPAPPDLPREGEDIGAWLGRQPGHETPLQVANAPDAASAAAADDANGFTGTWSRPFLAHASIGLSCALAWLRDGQLEIWSHSQGIFALRAQIARVTGREADSVQVHHLPGAGCYGHNGADDAALDAALVALARPGTPVRVQWSRVEELTQAPFGAAMAATLGAVLDASGRIVRWHAHIASTSHGTRPGMHGEPNLLAAPAIDPQWRPQHSADVPEAIGGGASRNARPIYDVGALDATLKFAQTPVRSSALRALGAHLNVFAIEAMMDELAARAGVEPAAFRRRHLSDARALAVLDRVLAMSGWARLAADPGAAVGLGLARYKGRGAWCAVVAEIELDLTVAVRRVWCAVDAGCVVNPDGARNQVEGGIVQSVSWTTLEAVRFDEHGALAGGWRDYPVLRFPEVPQIETVFIGPSQANDDGGSLGVGECSQGPTAAAIGNAVARAIGQRVMDLPIDRERLLRLLSA